MMDVVGDVLIAGRLTAFAGPLTITGLGKTLVTFKLSATFYDAATTPAFSSAHDFTCKGVSFDQQWLGIDKLTILTGYDDGGSPDDWGAASSANSLAAGSP